VQVGLQCDDAGFNGLMLACNATMHATNEWLLIDKTTMQTSIAALQVNNVAMQACNGTMQAYNVTM
jgi:hypothetical protein